MSDHQRRAPASSGPWSSRRPAGRSPSTPRQKAAPLASRAHAWTALTVPAARANGGGTVRLATPLVRPAVAVIVAVPVPTAVASPSGVTVATVVLSVDHETARPKARSPEGVRNSA